MDRRQFLSLSAAALAFVYAAVADPSGDPSAASPEVPAGLRRPREVPPVAAGRLRQGLSTQVQIPEPGFPSAAAGVFLGEHGLQRSDAGHLLVLSYHDIGPPRGSKRGPSHSFTVPADVFASHLRMLRLAGFRSVRLADVLAARHSGGSLPPRPVLITFDDGPRGQWVYADRCLAAERFTAATFLITGYVGMAPGYVDWDEVRAMVDSRRWEIGDHTHLGHHRVPIGPRGTEESVLINRIWDSRDGRLELRVLAEQRVQADINRSQVMFETRGLPQAQAFAYPFSQVSGPTNDPAMAGWVDRMLAARFPLRFCNNPPARLADAATLATGLLPRLEVHSGLDAMALYRWIQEANAGTATASGNRPIRRGWSPPQLPFR